ncbi:putative diphthamide synthesis protein-domain-containing protein [Obelidium mucronatum]|nr:putative diphthamide synthesis protein-domain-containing protein [Obelidium mucronatum]
MSIDILTTFEIQRTLDTVLAGSYVNIALQFPDELLAYSTDVALLLDQRSNAPDATVKRTFYILADTTYGSCCVDEVAAEHVNADLVVHYGRTCLSRTARIPVLYVFGNPPVDMDHLSTSVSTLIPFATPILFVFDAVYSHSAPSIAARLSADGFKDMVVSVIDTEVGVVSSSAADDSKTSYGRKYVIPEGRELSEYTLLYIGAESLTLTNILMTHNSNQSFSYDPALKVAREETASVNKLLRRRYVMVQKAKDADVIGIVVGTLGVVSYLPLIEHLKRLIIAKGKKPYLIAVGKPSPAKLGNFMEIQVFVLVACPENTLVDSKEFMQPIVTPFELEIALVSNKEWTGAYETDLAKLADRIGGEAVAAENEGGGDVDDDEPHFSLITGGYKQRKQYQAEPSQDHEGEEEEAVVGADGVVAIRKPAGAVSKFTMNSAAAEYLNNSRSWTGVEVKLGETAVELATEGRAGVASGFVGEGTE